MNFSFFTNLPRPPGSIPFLLKPLFHDTSSSYNWFNAFLESKHRTYKDWLDLIAEYEKPLFPKSTFVFDIPKPAYVSPAIPDPFYHRDVIASCLRELLTRNMRLRWLLRILVRTWRFKHTCRRVVGTTDVATLSEIPETWKVTVCDIASRSVYVFHALSLQKMVKQALLNQSYAIASPGAPKNPYTNVPWHLGQIIHIVGQIQIRLMENCHTLMDSWLLHYFRARYCLLDFSKRHNRALQISAAKTFFAEPGNLFFLELFHETVNDLFDMMGFRRLGLAYNMIMDRILKKDLMKQWDEIVVMSFIHVNHNFFPHGYTCKSRIEMERYLGDTYLKTIQYANSMKPPLRVRVPAILPHM